MSKTATPRNPAPPPGDRPAGPRAGPGGRRCRDGRRGHLAPSFVRRTGGRRDPHRRGPRRHPRHLRRRGPDRGPAALPLGERAPHPDPAGGDRARLAVPQRRVALRPPARGDRTAAAGQPLPPRRRDHPRGGPRRARRHRGRDPRHLVARPRRELRPLGGCQHGRDPPEGIQPLRHGHRREPGPRQRGRPQQQRVEPPQRTHAGHVDQPRVQPREQQRRHQGHRLRHAPVLCARRPLGRWRQPVEGQPGRLDLQRRGPHEPVPPPAGSRRGVRRVVARAAQRLGAAVLGRGELQRRHLHARPRTRRAIPAAPGRNARGAVRAGRADRGPLRTRAEPQPDRAAGVLRAGPDHVVADRLRAGQAGLDREHRAVRRPDQPGLRAVRRPPAHHLGPDHRPVLGARSAGSGPARRPSTTCRRTTSAGCSTPRPRATCSPART